MATQPEYNAGSITILEGLEAVRKRPGMYIGSTGPRGLHHLIWEVVDNSVDEAMAGHATKVIVRLMEDGGVEVTDDGRGIPVGMHASGVPTVQVVMTQLHAGGKFDSDSYAVSGGLHGVGISVVNALSTRVEAEIKTDGKHWYQEFNNAVPAELKEGGNARGTGTKIRFWADPEIFETTEYDYSTIARRLQEMAFLNKGLTIQLIDERVTKEQLDLEAIADAESGEKQLDETSFDDEDVDDFKEAGAQTAAPAEIVESSKKLQKKVTYHYPDGLIDYVKFLNKTKSAIHPTVVAFDAKANDHEVEVAMQWNQGYKESTHTFANTINTYEGGTHEEGFRSALTSLMNRYAKEHKLMREKDGSLTGDDCRGLAAVVSLKVSEPQFEARLRPSWVTLKSRVLCSVRSMSTSMTGLMPTRLRRRPLLTRQLLLRRRVLRRVRRVNWFAVSLQRTWVVCQVSSLIAVPRIQRSLSSTSWRVTPQVARLRVAVTPCSRLFCLFAARS